MFLARVTGKVWATAKDPGLNAQRLLIVQPLTPELKESGRRQIVTDCVGAGAGELVYCCRGRESSFPFLPAQVPTDVTVVGIIDQLTFDRSASADRPNHR